MAEKQILYSVDVKLDDAVKKMAELEKSLAKVNAEIKEKSAELAKAQADAAAKTRNNIALTDEESAEIDRLTQELIIARETRKAYSKEISEQSRQVQNSVIAEQTYADTLKGLCAQLSLAKDELRAMKTSDPGWEEQRKKVEKLNDKVKAMEESYGVYTRNVGNYSKSFMDAFSKMGGSAAKLVNPLKNVTMGLKAMSSTGIIGILGVLVNIIGAIIQKLKSSEDNLNAVNKSMSAFGVIGDAVTVVTQSLGKAIAWLADGLVYVLEKLGLVSEAMKQRQAIAEAEIQLARQQRETIVQNADAELEVAQLRAKAAEKTRYTEQERIEFLKEAGKLESEISQRAYEAAKLEYEIIKAKNSLTESSAEEKKAEAEAYANMIKAQTAYFNKTKELNSQIAEAQKSAADKAYSRWEKTFNAIAKLQKDLLASRSTYLKDWGRTEEENAALRFAHEQKYALMSLRMTQEQNRKKLQQQLAYGKITATAYREELKSMQVEMNNFLAAQANELYDFQKEMLANAVELAGGKMLEDRLTDMRTKFALAEKSIRDDAEMSAEEKSYYLENLAQKQTEEERRIRTEAREKTDKEIAAIVDRTYEDDRRRFSASEEEKISLEEDRLRDLVAARRKAGLDTFEQEQELMQLEADKRAAALDRELQLNWKNAEKQYEIRREFLEKELELENLTAEQRAAIEQELAEMQAESIQARISAFEEYAGAAMEIAANIISAVESVENAELEKSEERNTEKKEALKKQLDAGLISQKQYDKQVAKMDEDLDKEKAKIARKQAIRQRAMSVMQIGLDTASAIMKIWAEFPKFDFGAATIAMTAVAAAVGASQLAAVLATPLPQAREGGLVSGPKHEQGGVLINTEGDERIISANPSRAFPELLNLISYIGKHAGVPDTGYAARHYAAAAVPAADSRTEPLDYDRLADKIGEKVTEAVAGLKIYTAVEDIRRKEDEYDKIINSAKI